MRRILILITLSCVAFPSFATENELKIGVTTASRFTNNALNVSTDKEDSFAFEIGPRFQFDMASTQYEGGMTYLPRFIIYTDERKDNVSHVFAAHGDFRANQRLTFRARDNLRLEFDEDRDYTDFSEPSVDGSGDKQTFRNRFNFETRYMLTPRLSMTGTFGSFVVSREDKDLSDSNEFSGNLQIEYVMSQRDSIGVGVLARNQEVDGRINENRVDIGDTTTDSDGVFLSWKHQFSPLLNAHAAGGPTWVTTDRENDGRSTNTDLEYFVRAGVEGEYDGGRLTVEFTRSAAEYSRTSQTYLIDAVTLRSSKALNRKLTLGVFGEWNQRKAILEQPGDNIEDNVKQLIFAGTLSYRLTSELSGHLTLDYLRQDTDIDKPSERFRAVIRLDYNARTFQF